MKRKMVFVDRNGDEWDFHAASVTVTRRRDGVLTTYGDLFYTFPFLDKDEPYLLGRYEESDDND